MIPERELDEIRSRADIVGVIGEKIPLKKAGRNFKGLCPFHAEKTPSFMVNPERQIYHCFGCGEGGNVFSFLMKYEGLEFPDAVERLAERFGVVLSRTVEEGEGIRKGRAEKDRHEKINRLACRFFYEQLVQGEAGAKGRDYLLRRGIRDEMIREALLGYAPPDGKALSRFFSAKKVPWEEAEKLGLVRRSPADNQYYDFFRDRLIFAIVSGDGKVLGFSGRALEDAAQPKYLNSPDSPLYHKGDSLLGIRTARPAIREKDEAILVEGNFDLLRLHQEGVRNVVAPLGTALTDGQVRALSRMTRNFVLLFDGDEAGHRASDRALEIFLPMGIFPRAVLLPEGEDPDSFVRKKGIDPLKELLSRAPHLLDLRMERIFGGAGSGPEGRGRAVREVVGLLSKLPGEIEKRLSIQRVAERFGLSEGLLLRESQAKKGQGARKGGNFSEGAGDEEGSKLPPMERMVLEILLSGSGNPEVLFREISIGDFSDPSLGRIWEIVKGDYERHGAIDVARILTVTGEEGCRRLIARLVAGGDRWMEGSEGEKAVSDCLRKVRVTRIKERLKTLSQEIRQAEMASNGERVHELVGQKNVLIKEMMGLH